jgi:hypothetical protein
VDKDLYFGELLTLKVVFGPGTKIGGTAVSATDPTATPLPLAVDTTVSGLTLYLACEQNESIVNMLKAKVKAGDFKMLCQDVRGYRQNTSATSPTISHIIKNNLGHHLQKIYHSVYNNVETANTAYDHDNTNGIKFSSYYTQLDSVKRQQSDIVCTTANPMDYMVHQDKLRGTPILNQNIYAYNHVVIDDFAQFPGFTDLKSNVPMENQIAGVPLDIDRKWDFCPTTSDATPLNQYTYIVRQRTLNISPGNTRWT